MSSPTSRGAGAAIALATAALALHACAPAAPDPAPEPHAKNVIFFVGDGMGVSTVTAARVFSVGVDGELALDRFPYTALSRTYTTDKITADSAGTITAMVTGVNANSGVLGFGGETERSDFNRDGDGPPLPTILELCAAAGKRVGVVSTARVTHATPAGCYAHINERDRESDIALQALPTDPTYNTALGDGLDLMLGGGRRFFVPRGTPDEEGVNGRRRDGRDLRREFEAAGYTYVWNQEGFDGLEPGDLPVLGLWESSHAQYEHDRPQDAGGEPSLTEQTIKALELFEDSPEGFFLLIEGGRIDHAHHEGNAYRALVDTEEFDSAIAAALERVDLSETLVVATADHSHTFTIGGYPLRPLDELPYPVKDVPEGYAQEAPGNGILDTVYDVDLRTGRVYRSRDRNGVPYTALAYGNGPGHRPQRVDPLEEERAGYRGTSNGPTHPAYQQDAAVPMGSETHGGEEVTIYAIGRGSSALNGTVKNTFCFELMREALGL